MQTVGQVLKRPGAVRQPTQTDAALVAPLLLEPPQAARKPAPPVNVKALRATAAILRRVELDVGVGSVVIGLLLG